jgi:uncharacterized protein
MRIVLDTNVIIAAFAARGLCESVFEVCLSRHEILLSKPLLAEVRLNLSKKLKFDRRLISQIERLLHENGEVLEPAAVKANACRDDKDLHILGLAKAGRADFIITGDNDLLSLKHFGTCQIVNPRQFSTLLREG